MKKRLVSNILDFAICIMAIYSAYNHDFANATFLLAFIAATNSIEIANKVTKDV